MCIENSYIYVDSSSIVIFHFIFCISYVFLLIKQIHIYYSQFDSYLTKNFTYIMHVLSNKIKSHTLPLPITNPKSIKVYKQINRIMKQRLIILSIAILLQIIQLFKNRTKRIAKETLLNITRQLSALSPTELIKNFDKLQDYGICFGSAFASQKCTSVFRPRQSVIVSKLYQLNNLRFREDLDQLKKLILTKRPTFFTLNDKFSSIPILQTANLPTITTHGIFKTNSVDKTSNINIIIYLINIFKNIRLPYIAETSYCQNYLPEGTQVAILGKYKREATGRICCEKPLIMGTSKGKIVEKIQMKVTQLNFEKFALLFGIAFCVGFGMKQLYNLYLERKNVKRDPIDNFDDKLYVKSRVCYNCRQKLSNFIMETCGHMSMCKECKDKLQICGQCKKRGQNGLQLYAC